MLQRPGGRVVRVPAAVVSVVRGMLPMETRHNWRTRLQAVAAQFIVGIAGLGLVTFVCFRLGFGLGRTAFAYVILLALVSLLGSFGAAAVLSIVAAACLNYFFSPPLFDLRIDDPDDIARIAAFLTASLVVTALTTRLKRTGKELGESNAKLEATQRIAQVGWWERDLSTGRVALSDEVCRTLGVQPVDLPEWHARWLELIHPEDRARVAEAAAAALVRGGPRFDVEYRVVRSDGTVRAVHSQSDVTWDDSGRPLRQFGVLQDITELRRAEQELRASEARFRTFADHATDAFFLLDDHATVLDTNRQALESLGYGREELIGRHQSDFDPGLNDASVESLKQRIVAGEAVTFETRHKRKDGSSFPVEVRVGQFEQGGRRFLCLVRDITKRKRAEEELRASEQRFRTLVQFSFDLYSWETDAQHRFIRQELAEGLAGVGLPFAEIGKTRWEMPYLEPDADAWRKYRETLDAHQPFRNFEIVRPTPDGGKRFLSISGMPIFDESGRFVGYRGVGRDITQRKRAEDELRTSEERFRTLVQFSFDVYWETDAEHRFIRQEFAEGLADAPAPSSEIGKTRWEVPYLEPDAEGWRKHRETLDAHLPFRDFELARPTPDGGKRYVAVSGLPVFDKTGRFVGYRGVGRHITERKKAEEALRRSEVYLAESERLNHSGAFAFNAKETLYWSEGIYRLWGFDPLHGIPSREAWWQRTHPEDRSRAHDELQEALRQKRAYAIEYRLALPDGTVKHVRSIGHPSYSADGELVEVVGTTTDVTERVRAQQEHERLRQLETDLAHLNRLSIMGELTASLAHEILHPIAAARNNARAGMRFLEMSPPDLQEVREALACVVRDADRGKEIVSRIRDHIKKAPPQEEPVDLKEAITEVIVMVRNAIDRNRVSVRTCLVEQMAFVRGDRVGLQQVVLNLILNAVEAMASVEESERELSISTELTQTGDILVAVRDTGPGVDPEQLERLFKPFYTTKATGLGMGLSICRSTIDAHGGRLWAEANQPRGTVFHFTLPTASQAS
jgi:PAS domain S-box-containing protein